MTEDQQKTFDRLVAAGRYHAAVIYLANVMLGPDLASKIIRCPQ